ncbi:MAG: hypothetical protein NVV82_27600 [Sporocytophaga sp.]|nr:hypothetical protein [Sporocytophaga sp.]
MSNDKSHNEKLPIDDLFRDVFSDHKETVDDKDFDQFLGKLEETGFFDKNKSRFLVIFILTSIIVGGSIFYFTLPSQKDKPKEPINASVKSSEIFTASEAIENGDKVEVMENSKEANIDHDVIHLKKSQPVSDTNNNSQSVHQQETVEDKQVEILNPVIRKKDTVTTNVIPVPPVLKPQKDSIRVKYIIQVDTIKTIDSMNIKKRKWDKMKGKNK